MKDKIKKYFLPVTFWFLSPFLGDDNKPSIKRFLIVLFAYEIHDVVNTRPWNLQSSIIITIFVITIGILLGLTSYSTLVNALNTYKPKPKPEHTDE